MCVCYLSAGARSISEGPSYWWVAGLVIGVLVLALVGVLAYLKVKGKDGVQTETQPDNYFTKGGNPVTISIKTEIHTV